MTHLFNGLFLKTEDRKAYVYLPVREGIQDILLNDRRAEWVTR